ncbi:unnamed protein product [Paramecium primaurelia]|uniref:Uncharacterized protein n=1 Tax=Paramecium primaurelia TaxID=5886 RepID=A0A8S1M8V9_PARPR|nr:unnamed protein product [Paramecium primaurelia]
MLTLTQMDEIIKLTEQHMINCQFNYDFKEADEVKSKILQMKTIRDLIEREEIQEQFKLGEERILSQTKQQIDEVNQYFNQLFEKFNYQKSQALQQLWHQQKIKLQKSVFYKRQQNAEYQNLQKIMTYLSNQKEFKKAEQYQVYLKEASQDHMRRTQSEQRQTQETQQRVLKQKHAYQEEVLINKFNDQEQLIKLEMNKKLQEIEQKRINQITQLQFERNQKITQLERSRTKSIKVQIQQQLDEMEKCSFLLK